MPNGLAAISKVPAAGWGQILAYMAFCEVSQDQSPGTPAAAGDFGFKVLTSSDPEEKTKKLSAELANGRLAMMAIIGMFFQEIISCFKTLEELISLQACHQTLIYVFMSFIWQPADLRVVYDAQSWQSKQHEGVCFTTQDGLTGSAWGDWANYTASPLRAFENELGVQAPVGLLAFQH